PVITTAAMIRRQGRFDLPPVGGDAVDVFRAPCCCGGVCRGGAAVACVRRAALCAAALPVNMSISSSKRDRRDLLSARARHSSKTGSTCSQFSVLFAYATRLLRADCARRS